MSGMKLSFSLTNNSKRKKRNKLELAAAATAVVGGVASSPSFVATMEGFEPLYTDDATKDLSYSSYNASSGYSRGPLIIPVQDDNRPSLQEQARIRRLQRDNHETPSLQDGAPSMVAPSHPKAEEDEEDDDQAAIEALRNEAGQQQISMSNHPSLNMVIEGSQNTFQRNGSSSSSAGAGAGGTTKRGVNHTITDHNDNDDDIPFQQELNRYAPELSVDSASYRHVPIADFGAAMLRGMGWTGQQAVGDNDTSSTTQLPRPSRLGLGATPKLDPSMAAPPTHGGNSHKRMRRQDQVQRDQQLKLQQEEYEKKRLEQIKFDKQRTVQDGSIVWIESSSMPTTTITPRRAVIRKWQGVPGLNMCLVQFEQPQQEEQQEDPVKVKKGDVRLIDREELHVRPFLEPKVEPREEKVQYLGMDDCQQERIRDPDGKNQQQVVQQRFSKEKDQDYRRRDRMVDDDDDKRRRQDRKHHRDEESTQYQDQKRHKLDERSSHATTTPKSSTTTTWLIPHIRVRVISSKVGKQFYKEKGIVVDVTRNGTATLTMGNGQVIQAPERYLETALPKVGGNVCILVGEHRLAKGKLLERDSRKNRGAIQVFEDMTIVTTSLDDMAEWCGPLDDDLME
jgi:G patch domain and KOW motifs-containing protein